MEMDAVDKLSEEQKSALSGDLLTVFCALREQDQDFFAQSFNPVDLPIVLQRKKEIMMRNSVDRERLDQLSSRFAEAASSIKIDNEMDQIISAAALAIGLGGSASTVATDNTAFYQGVKPSDLIDPLFNEFQTDQTRTTNSGSLDTQSITIFFRETDRNVPAMTINLSTMKNGTTVVVNELTSQGILSIISSSGRNLLDLASQGFDLLSKSRDGITADEVLSTAGATLENGTDLVKSIQALKLKERAWKVINSTAQAFEKAYINQIEIENHARYVLEFAWDKYYNCPTCGVVFSENDKICRVCGSGRPERPIKPDPRRE